MTSTGSARVRSNLRSLQPLFEFFYPIRSLQTDHHLKTSSRQHANQFWADRLQQRLSTEPPFILCTTTLKRHNFNINKGDHKSPRTGCENSSRTGQIINLCLKGINREGFVSVWAKRDLFNYLFPCQSRKKSSNRGKTLASLFFPVSSKRERGK